MSSKTCRLLLLENCPRGMSQTFAQLAFHSGAGVKISLVANLQDAKERLQNNAFNLALLAPSLPEVGGLDALQALRQLAPGLPVAVVLNEHEQHLREEMLQNGAVGVFNAGAVALAEVFTLAENSPPQTPAPPKVSSKKQTRPRNRKLPESAKQPPKTAAAPPQAKELAALRENLRASERELTLLRDLAAAETVQQKHLSAKQEKTIAELQEQIAAQTAQLRSHHERLDSQKAQLSGQAAELESRAAQIAGQKTATQTALKEQQESMTAQIAQEREAAAKQIEQMRESLASLKSRCAELEAGQTALLEAEHLAIERERQAREKAEEEVRQLRRKLTTVNEVHQETLARLRELEENAVDVATAESLKELAEARAKQNALNAEINRVKQEQGKISAAQKELHLAKENLQNKLAGQEAANMALENELTKSQKAKAALTDAYEESQALNAELADKLAAQVAQAQAATTRVQEEKRCLKDELQARAENIQTRLAAEKERHAATLAAQKDAESQLGRLGQELAKTQTEIQELNATAQQLPELESRARAAEEELKRALARCRNLEKKCATLGEMQQAAAGQAAAAANVKAADKQVGILRQALIIEQNERQRLDAEMAAAETGVAAELALQEQVAVLRRERDAAVHTLAAVSQEQLAKVEELTTLYEKAQMAKIDLLRRLTTPESN